jgi:hypothetical protein
MAWLVEEAHGIRQTCRSYYMMQQLQSRYVMEKPQEIKYGTDDGLISSSEALLNGKWGKSRLYVRYPGDLKVWINGNAESIWKVDVRGDEHILPPFGWIAVQGSEFFESSEILDGTRCDRVVSPAYVFLDGRGVTRNFEGITTSGSLAVKPLGKEGLIFITVEGVEKIGISTAKTIPDSAEDVRTMIAKAAEAEELIVEAFNADGTSLGKVSPTKSGDNWEISPVVGGLRYEVRFGDK